jgi:hypothetical protein
MEKRREGETNMTCKGLKTTAVFLTALLLGALGGAAAATGPAKRPSFDDVKARTAEFIGWSHSIRLTPEQEEAKRRALSSVPAPCCQEYSIATCCCPCNLAKTVWGLANYAVARLGYDVAQTRALTLEWLQATNPAGSTGDACHRGGCPKPFSADGCGGMDEGAVVF